MSEVKELLGCLGRTGRDSEVRDTHLSQVLTYLAQKKTERLKSTISKLTIICGMQKRCIRENYIEGLIEFGVISVEVIQNEEVWNWNGMKAFRKPKNGDGA